MFTVNFASFKFYVNVSLVNCNFKAVANMKGDDPRLAQRSHQ